MRHSGQRTVKVSLRHEDRAALVQSIAMVSKTLCKFYAITEQGTTFPTQDIAAYSHFAPLVLGGK